MDGKVKQRIMLYIGSDPLLRDKNNRKTVLEVLKSMIFKQADLLADKVPKNLFALAQSHYDKYLIKYGDQSTPKVSVPPNPTKAEFHNIDIKGLEVSDVKSYGAEHLCKQVIDKLELKACLTAVGLKKNKSRKTSCA